MSNDKLELYKILLTTITSIATIIIATIGLSTWRKKLMGENKYSLSMSTLKELYATLECIKNFRANIYTSGELSQAYYEQENKALSDDLKEVDKANNYAESRRWNEVVTQYLKMKEQLLKLKVILDDYDIDKVSNMTIEDYIRELNSKRAIKYMIMQDKEDIRTMNEIERKEYQKEMADIHKVLSHQPTNDIFIENINNYFKVMKGKLKKYLK